MHNKTYWYRFRKSITLMTASYSPNYTFANYGTTVYFCIFKLIAFCGSTIFIIDMCRLVRQTLCCYRAAFWLCIKYRVFQQKILHKVYAPQFCSRTLQSHTFSTKCSERNCLHEKGRCQNTAIIYSVFFAPGKLVAFFLEHPVVYNYTGMMQASKRAIRQSLTCQLNKVHFYLV